MVAENFAQGPYFGDFGGRFVAESLMGPLEEVEAAWKHLWRDKSFQRRLRDLFAQSIQAVDARHAAHQPSATE